MNVLTAFVDDIIKDSKEASENAFMPSHKNEKSRYDQVTQKPNVYACPGFEKHFRSLCLKFPSWTNVIATTYGYEGDELNSARSETYFKIKKSLIPRPISLLRFLLRDALKIQSAATRDYPSLRKVTNTDETVQSGRSIFDQEDSSSDN